MCVNAASGLLGGNIDAVDNLDEVPDNLEVDNTLRAGRIPGCFRFLVNSLIAFKPFSAFSKKIACFSFSGSGRLSV